MNAEPGLPLKEAMPPGLTIEELEARLETTCLDFDPCLGAFCWQFGSEYGCDSQCAVHCHPFLGCNPYCYE